ncbi:MAG TPA: hypothetical protein VLF21_02265 [Candidatus Saccharimonadales bacterium]|nr:hypothetical protein [Candidatus Saccharimonadales bacterium]
MSARDDHILALLKVKHDLVALAFEDAFDINVMTEAIQYLLRDTLEVKAQLAFDSIEGARDLVRRDGDVIPSECLPAHTLLLDLVQTGDLPEEPSQIRQKLVEGVDGPWGDDERLYYWADRLANYAGRFSVYVMSQRRPYHPDYDGPLQQSLRQFAVDAASLQLPTHSLREYAATISLA